MEYPQDFKDACVLLYPKWRRLRLLLDSGSEMVGRYLDDASFGEMKPEAILAATSLEVLKRQVRERIKARNLYARWRELYEEQQERSL